jgi:diguanylate cyclase (GGDEF)-like protein/PAS domain S-box-containing protein
VLVALFVVQILAAVSLVGFLSHRNGLRATEDLIWQLQERVAKQVEEHLNGYLATPHQLTRILRDAAELGTVDLSSVAGVERFLWRLAKTFPAASYLNYGLENGHFIGVGRADNGSEDILIEEAEPQSISRLRQYEAGSGGQRGALRQTLEFGNFHDQVWYREPKEAGRAIWTRIYNWVDNPQIMVISAGEPIHGPDGSLRGVAGVDLFLANIHTFLMSLKISPSTRIFIIERDGAVVATSALQLPFRLDAGEAVRLRIGEVEDEEIRDAAAALQRQLGGLAGVTARRTISFEAGGVRHFASVSPWRDRHGLDWLIAVATDESDFMDRIQANTRVTLALTGVAMLVAVIVGWLTARWIADPIARLSDAARSFADADFTRPAAIDRSDEIGQLAHALNAMAAQLEGAFRTLREDRERLSQFLEAIPVGIAIHRPDGSLYYINEAGRHLCGSDATQGWGEHNGHKSCAIRHRDAASEPVQTLPLERALEGAFAFSDALHLYRGNDVIPLQMSATPVFGPDGTVEYAITAFQDTTERRKAEAILHGYNLRLAEEVRDRTEALEREIRERKAAQEALRQANRELERLATEDGLTKVANRRRLEDYLAQEWKRLTRTHQPLSVILFDVDHFKAYNDVYGHPRGDESLARVAALAAQILNRPADLVARYGGEEFICVMPETDAEGALKVAERLRDAVEGLRLEHEGSDASSFVTISAGVAGTIPEHDVPPSALVFKADQALYRAKRAGRNRCELAEG